MYTHPKLPNVHYTEQPCPNPDLEGPCHACVKAHNGYGYCQVRIGGRNGKSVLVHRLVYETDVGPIPAGLVIDHMCKTRNCCNPKHLRAITAIENSDISLFNSSKTHCKHGHEFTPANTMKHTSPGLRKCRTCHNLHKRRARWAKCPMYFI